jgi:hypothetical protein
MWRHDGGKTVLQSRNVQSYDRQAMPPDMDTLTEAAAHGGEPDDSENKTTQNSMVPPSGLLGRMEPQTSSWTQQPFEGPSVSSTFALIVLGTLANSRATTCACCRVTNGETPGGRADSGLPPCSGFLPFGPCCLSSLGSIGSCAAHRA